MWLVQLALRRPYTIAVLAVVILLTGSLSAYNMRQDIFPTIDIPVVIVVWSYPGLSAEDMERRVVLLSERAYSTTVSGISYIESQSISGIGMLKIYFEAGADIGAAIGQITAVSLTASHNMPPGIPAPNILQYNASNVPVAQLTVRSQTLSEQQLFDYGLNFLRIRLFTIPGLATPAPYGGKARQVMVDVDPAAMAAHGLSAQDVLNALLQANLLVPAGTMRVGGTEYDVAINNSPTSIEEFSRIPVKVLSGATVYLGDVAQVHDGFAVQNNVVRVDGRRSTYLALLRKSGASTLAVVDSVKELLPLIRKTAPEGTDVSLDFDQSVFVRSAVSGVLHEAVAASILVSVMILLFLGSWRSVIIVSTSIPLAIFVAILGLYLQDQTLNIMTLGGLSLAIGMLVDDATVEVENIHRNRHLGKALTVAIMDGAAQIATPALAATLTICIVFCPVVLLYGPARFLFTPLAFSVVYAMLASYVLSRTLVPVLARMLMKSEALHPSADPSLWERFNIGRDRLFDNFQESYGRVLAVILRHRAFVLVCVLFTLIGLVPLALSVGTDFFPEVDAGQMRLHVRAPLGTRIEDTEHLLAAVEQRIRTLIPASELESITDNMGVPTSYNLAFIQSDNIGGQDADVLIALKHAHQPTQKHREALREVLNREFIGSHFYFQPADIISQVLNFGLSAPVDIEIEGPKLEQSMDVARALRDAMRGIYGVVDVRIPQVLSHPAMQVNVDRLRAAQLGLSQSDVANNMLASLSSSALVNPSFWLNPNNNVNYLVAVQTPLEKAHSVDDLLSMPITGKPVGGADNTTPFGSADTDATYMGSIADLVPIQTKSLISHSAVQRVVQVQCGVEGRDLGNVSADIQAAIDQLKLPPNTHISIRGQSESMRGSFRSLGLGLILAGILVYLLMVMLFQSWVDPLIIMGAVPGALVGVIVMLTLTHTTINVESLMGTIMAVGVAVSNSILLVNFANDTREEKEIGAVNAAWLAGKTRLRPVLMTALAMIIGMLPMATGAGEGGEQNAPLARAVIGGLCVATCVTLLVIPVIYTLLRRAAPNKGQLDAQFEAELQEPAEVHA